MSMNVVQAHSLIQKHANDPHFKVVDVRSGMERGQGYIPDSIHVPLSDIETRLKQFSKDTTYLVYCRSGARSGSAAHILKSHGFKAINMDGGISDWIAENYPLK